MKRTLRKILSLVAAVGIVVSAIPQGVSAYDAFSPFSSDANDITVNSSHTGFTTQPTTPWFYRTTTDANELAGNMKAYKLTNSYGLTGGNSLIEFVAREQRQNIPTVELNNVAFTTDSDFYATMDIYMGAARENDVLQVGGRYQDASGTNRDAIFFLDGRGDLPKTYGINYSALANNRSQGGYAPNNWYRVTMAVISKDVKMYFDDICMNGASNGTIAADLADMGSDVLINFFGARIRNFTDTSDFGGVPQNFAIKNLSIHSGTYNPANTDTTVTSGAYTVTDKSVWKVGWLVWEAMESTIADIPADTTVSTLLGNISLPAGATAKVVTINNDDKATTEIASGEVVTSAMKLFVTAADGAMKLYDLDAAVSAGSTPTITSSLTRYAIDNENKIITAPNTTVEKLTSVVTGVGGTTVTVKDELGSTVVSGTVRDTMTLVASKNGINYEYRLELNDPAKAFNVSNALSAIADGTLLLETTRSSETGINTPTTDSTSGAQSYLVGFTGTNALLFSAIKSWAGTGKTYQVYKNNIPDTDIAAYRFTYPKVGDDAASNIGHKAGNMVETTNNAEKGDKMVINFKLYIPSSGGQFTIYPYHAGYKTAGNPGSGIGGYDLQIIGEGINTGIGDRVTFAANGDVNLGGFMRPNGGYAIELSRGGNQYGAKIGTYAADTLYDVTVVESRGTWDDSGTQRSTVITEGVYLNGTNLLAEPNVLRTSQDREYFAIREIAFFTQGTVYMSGLNIYMTDNYDPTPYVAPTSTPASLTITSATLGINSTNKRITGWSGLTAAGLKAAIDSDVNAEVTVLNVEGDSEMGDLRPVQANMLLKVKDKNLDNVEYYLLDSAEDTGTQFAVSAGNITATRTITINNAEASMLHKTLILAGYDMSGTHGLKQLGTQTKNIQAPNTYEYSISLEYNPLYTYRAFLWDISDGSLTPFEPFTPYIP